MVMGSLLCDYRLEQSGVHWTIYNTRWKLIKLRSPYFFSLNTLVYEH